MIHKLNGARYVMGEAGRRWGKSRFGRTRSCEHLLCDWRGQYDEQSPPVVAIVMPEQKRAKALHWKPLLDMFEKSPVTEDINKTDLRITFRRLKYEDGVSRRPPDLVLAGADRDADKLRGFRLWGVLLDEYQDFPPTAWNLVIRPALADTPRSWAYFIFTPKGKASVAAKLKRQQREKDGWFYFHAKTRDNPFIDPKEVEKAEDELPPRDFRQEYEASEEDFPGRIYSEFKREDHVVKSYPEDYDEAWIGFDCGDVNPGLVLDVCKFVGKVRYWWRVHAEHMGDGSNAIADSDQDEKIAALAKRWERVRGVILSPERKARMKDLRKLGAKEQIPALVNSIPADNSVSEGNACINSLFHQNRLFIVDGCSIQPNDIDAADELESYHRKQDKFGNFLDEPADGQQDHRNEAGRYLHFTIKQGKYRSGAASSPTVVRG